MAKNTEMELEASLPAADLARLQRRIAFLEAALIQVMRDDHGLKEYFTASEIACLGLPGLPTTRNGIARVAREQSWDYRTIRGPSGEQRVYHFADLPRRAFGAFVEPVVDGGRDLGAHAHEAAGAPAEPATNVQLPSLAASVASAAPAASNTTPAWTLPLLRLLRRGGGPLDHALAELPHHLATGVPCPSVDDARAILARIGVSAL
jgi:hypothetical protein